MQFTTSALLLAGAALAAAQSTTEAPTTTMATSSTASSSTSSAAATHTITVGKGGNTFSPPSVNASVGDSILFDFSSSSSHSVMQGEYIRPCEARDPSALFSGELSSSSATDQYIVKLNDTNPLWYFCSVGRHCQDGMVGVINPPAFNAGGYTLEGWTADSKNTSATNGTFVTKAQGGTLKSSGRTKGSDAEEGGADATGTTDEAAAAETSQGAAAGLVVKGGVVAGLGAFVAALLL